MRQLDTPLFGRTAELDQVLQKLRGDAQVVTLLGAGGVGKTTLAHAVASQWDGEVFFVDLSEAQRGQEVEPLLAHSTGLSLTGLQADEVLEATITRLNDRRAPLVFVDNAESAPLAAARAIDAIAAEATESRFLVTSRQPLRISAEHRVDLAPLDAEAAHELFDAWVRRIRGTPITEHESTAVHQLLLALDRIPLAIKLAASRSNMLSPRELCARVSDQMALLRQPGRNRDGRHATMHAAIDWSWQLLDKQGQLALSQCSVFPGSFSLDDAEAVLALPEPHSPAIDILHALRESSLIMSTTDEERSRFYLLQCIREFASQQRDALEQSSDTQARHSAHFAKQAERWALEAPEETAMASIEQNVANLSVLIAQGDENPAAAAKAALALDLHLASAASSDAWRENASHAVQLAERTQDRALIAQALVAFSRVERSTVAAADRAVRAQRLERARQLCVEANRPRLQSDVARQQGIQALYGGNFDEAVDFFMEARELAIQTGDEIRKLLATRNAANAWWRSGQRGRARQLVDATLAEIRNEKRIGWLSREAASFATDEGDLVQARLCLEREAQLEDVDSIFGVRRRCEIPLGLGDVCLEEGKLDEAAEHFELCRQRALHGGLLDIRAWAHWGLGIIALERLDLATAARELRVASDALRGTSLANHGVVFRAFLAAAIFETDPDEARSLLDQAANAIETAPAESYQSAIQTLLGMRFLLDANVAKGEPSNSDRALRASLDKHLASADQTWQLTRIAAKVVHDAAKRFDVARESGISTVGVASDGSFFEIDEQRVDLSRRPVLRRVFAFLVERHRTQPNRSTTPEEIRDAGWPGEAMAAKSASKRVIMAISTLRKLGLGQLLIRDSNGYRFARAVRLREMRY